MSQDNAYILGFIAGNLLMITLSFYLILMLVKTCFHLVKAQDYYDGYIGCYCRRCGVETYYTNEECGCYAEID